MVWTAGGFTPHRLRITFCLGLILTSLARVAVAQQPADALLARMTVEEKALVMDLGIGGVILSLGATGRAIGSLSRGEYRLEPLCSRPDGSVVPLMRTLVTVDGAPVRVELRCASTLGQITVRGKCPLGLPVGRVRVSLAPVGESRGWRPFVVANGTSFAAPVGPCRVSLDFPGFPSIVRDVDVPAPPAILEIDEVLDVSDR